MAGRSEDAWMVAVMGAERGVPSCLQMASELAQSSYSGMERVTGVRASLGWTVTCQERVPPSSVGVTRVTEPPVAVMAAVILSAPAAVASLKASSTVKDSPP